MDGGFEDKVIALIVVLMGLKLQYSGQVLEDVITWSARAVDVLIRALRYSN